MKKVFLIVILAVALIALAAVYFYAVNFSKNRSGAVSQLFFAVTPPSPVSTSQSLSVVTSTVENGQCGTAKNYLVTGISLSGLIEPGETVKVINDYYKCHTVQRDNIVAYNYAGRTNFIIKIVKAVPGDVWKLQSTDKGNLIVVNGQPLENSKGQEYIISDEKSAMLALYTKDYPKIPDKTYLLLGNDPQGTLDSTKFGLVGLQDIVGKVEKY